MEGGTPDPQAPAQWRSEEPPGGWSQPLPPSVRRDDTYAVKYGLGRAWGFTVASFGIWGFVWFHRNRKLFDGELGTGRDDALPHTFALLVPVLNLFVIHWLWRDISEARRRLGMEPFPDVPYLVGAVFLAPVFYSIVLGHVNEYWDVRTQGLASDAPVSTGEKLALAAGIAFWLFFVLLIVLAIVILAVAGTSS